MNDLVTVLINGDWDTSLEDRDDKSVIIYDEGIKIKIVKSKLDEFMDSLDYDCYLILEEFSHIEWNGIFRYEM